MGQCVMCVVQTSKIPFAQSYELSGHINNILIPRHFINFGIQSCTYGDKG